MWGTAGLIGAGGGVFCAQTVCLVPTTEPGLRDHKGVLVFIAGGEWGVLGKKYTWKKGSWNDAQIRGVVGPPFSNLRFLVKDKNHRQTVFSSIESYFNQKGLGDRWMPSLCGAWQV